jgi:flagellar basal-body rod protein FlgC
MPGISASRKIVSFENELVKRTGGASLQTVRVAGITDDKSPGQAVYNPQHPDAGPDGTDRSALLG